MKTITINKAKTQLSKLIKRVCRGEEVVIARGKHPVAKLVAISRDGTEGLRASLPVKSPFDRLLVAQAQALHLPILSADRGLDQYDIHRLW